MTYAYENHVPSRAEIVIGMAADAIRRWRDRRELAKFVQGSPGDGVDGPLAASRCQNAGWSETTGEQGAIHERQAPELAREQ